MISIIKSHISLKITLTLLVCLVVIFAFFSWTLIASRKQTLEQELLAKGQMTAQVGAYTISYLLEELYHAGHFSIEELFDENYQLITSGSLAGSAIPKYHTVYDHYLDEHIREIEDAFLVDPMVVFAVLVDRNGYLPTHNSLYSQPLTGDPEKDRIGNRTKRIFNDPVGLAAARFTGTPQERVLRQIYPRDTGVLMWDMAAPVYVDGRHWGAFRIGFSIEEIDASLDELSRNIILLSVTSIAVFALLVMFFVGKLTRPLKSLTSLAQAIASGQRKEKIDLQSNDEVGELVTAFNQMVDSLEHTTISRDFYDRLIHSMHDLLIVSDPAGQVVSINRATCEILGFDEEHIRKHKVQDLVKLGTGEQDWFADQLSAQRNYMADIFLVNCNGEQFPMSMSCSPLQDAEQNLTGFILTLQDNSQRIKAEVAKNKAYDKTRKLNDELLQINEEVEAKNAELGEAYKRLKDSQVQILQQEKMASIGQLAAGVAHEINNPMGFITSNLGTLEKYLDRLNIFIAQQTRLIGEQVAAEDCVELNSERKKLKIDYLLEDSRDLLDESLDGAARVKLIVQNLKTFSRLDQDNEQLADINECLESTINIAWNELKYKVSLEKDYGPLPELNCYPQKLNQVFLNMLVNAAQAIEGKGIVKVSTREEQGAIIVEISDTGCGIPEESLTRIFEPFYTTKEVGKGTGLGMSISYEIIKEHGGDIQVVSAVGKGTTFTIRLPLDKGGGTPER